MHLQAFRFLVSNFCCLTNVNTAAIATLQAIKSAFLMPRNSVIEVKGEGELAVITKNIGDASFW